jgi:hypothetical protein
MSEALAEHYASEAKRLIADDTFAEALTRIRAKALNELALHDADDRTGIVRLQQKVAVTDEILAEFHGMILAMGTSDGGFDPNKQTG